MHYTLCDLFSDLTQNAIEANAKVIKVELSQSSQSVAISIVDDGAGMTRETLMRATDPFYTDGKKHPGRKIGLGLPFLIQTAETCGGSWGIRTKKDGVTAIAGTMYRENPAEKSGRPFGDTEIATPSGTEIRCIFDLTNIDTPPIGDVPGYFRQILTFDNEYELIATRITPSDTTVIKRSEILEALGLSDEGSFSDANALALLGQYLESMEE